MKKISLLLMITLMTTSAYSGQDAPDVDDNGFVDLGASVAAAELRVHDPEGLRAALTRATDAFQAPGEEPAKAKPKASQASPAKAKPAPKKAVPPKAPFDVCAYLQAVRNDARQTAKGMADAVQKGWQQRPRVDCVTVQREAKGVWTRTEAGAEELINEMKRWYAAVQEYHDKGMPNGAAENAEVERLRRELEASQAARAEQAAQLADLQGKVEELRALFSTIQARQVPTAVLK